MEQIQASGWEQEHADFVARFADDDACLDSLRDRFYPPGTRCPKCGEPSKFHRIKGRSAYGCQYCRHQVYPTAGTIFHRSSTGLHLWFWAIELATSVTPDLSAKELERELGVTYKTARRMLEQIRSVPEPARAALLDGDAGSFDLETALRPQAPAAPSFPAPPAAAPVPAAPIAVPPPQPVFTAVPAEPAQAPVRSLESAPPTARPAASAPPPQQTYWPQPIQFVPPVYEPPSSNGHSTYAAPPPVPMRSAGSALDAFERIYQTAPDSFAPLAGFTGFSPDTRRALAALLTLEPPARDALFELLTISEEMRAVILRVLSLPPNARDAVYAFLS